MSNILIYDVVIGKKKIETAAMFVRIEKRNGFSIRCIYHKNNFIRDTLWEKGHLYGITGDGTISEIDVNPFKTVQRTVPMIVRVREKPKNMEEELLVIQNV